MDTIYKLFISSILPIVYARIDIVIKIPQQSENASVTFSGENVDIITGYDKQVFGLKGQPLKNGVELVSGRYPDSIFFNSPTPWDDLYKRFKWQPIYRTIKPYDAQILKMNKAKILLKKETFTNENVQPTAYVAAIQQDVDSDFLSIWNKSDLNPGEQIHYTLDFGEDENGEVYFKFMSFFGEDNRKMKPVTIGTKTPVKIELMHGQAVENFLYATKWTMELVIKYVAFLDGDLTCNFDPPLHGHHFWKFDVNDILTAMKVPLTSESIEKIRIVYYTNAYIVVRDWQTQENIFRDTVDIDYCLSTVRGVEVIDSNSKP